MKTLVFRSEAEEEYFEAIEWYENQLIGLGSEFRDEIESACLRILRSPRAYPLNPRTDTRTCLPRRFPYQIVFLELDDEIWVIAIAHERRDPSYWAHRIPE